MPGTKSKTDSTGTNPQPVDVQPETVIELKVTLLYALPPVWRRFTVPATSTLAELHDVVQTVMGWEHAHLHKFVASDYTVYGEPDPQGIMATIDERSVRLGEILGRRGDRLTYEYDFGDDWVHQLKVMDVRPAGDGEIVPMCLDGAGACPPEDCGGIGGYENLLAAVADPRHPDHDELSDWIGDSFDAEKFDMEPINRMLANW